MTRLDLAPLTTLLRQYIGKDVLFHDEYGWASLGIIRHDNVELIARELTAIAVKGYEACIGEAPDKCEVDLKPHLEDVRRQIEKITIYTIVEAASENLNARPDVVERKLVEMIRTIAEVVRLIPCVRINYLMTLLNWPNMILDETSMCLKKETYKKLRELGYDVNFGCVAACGFGSLNIKEEGDIICFEVIPCTCHPHNYFLTLEPTGR